VDADERVRRWAAQNIRAKLYGSTFGTHEGIRLDHYRWCPDLQVEVVGEPWEGWYSPLTYDGWKLRVQVTCPHGQVETSQGITPLTPAERILDAPEPWELDNMDAHEPHTPS
jgi:hypothetical protein